MKYAGAVGALTRSVPFILTWKEAVQNELRAYCVCVSEFR